MITNCQTCYTEKEAHLCSHCEQYLCFNCHTNEKHMKKWVEHYGIEADKSFSKQVEVGFGVSGSKGNEARHGDKVVTNVKQEDLGDRQKKINFGGGKTEQRKE